MLVNYKTKDEFFCMIGVQFHVMHFINKFMHFELISWHQFLIITAQPLQSSLLGLLI